MFTLAWILVVDSRLISVKKLFAGAVKNDKQLRQMTKILKRPKAHYLHLSQEITRIVPLDFGMQHSKHRPKRLTNSR
jgi:hypothetical protein